MRSVPRRANSGSCGGPGSTHHRTTLHPSAHQTHLQLIGPLAYSPDGRSICCASETSLITWDIQTGGVAKEIECGDTLDNLSSLVWSLDEKTVCAVLMRYNASWTVVTYDVTSGRVLRHGTLGSDDSPYLWPHDNSFRVMTTAHEMCAGPQWVYIRAYTINILEVGPALTQVESFHILGEQILMWNFLINSFSPISHHVSVSSMGVTKLSIVGGRGLVHWLNAEGVSDFHCFSPDGNLFAASFEQSVRVWKYIHGGPGRADYTPWRKFPYHGWSPNDLRLQFSPTSSSILGHFRDVLQVWRFDVSEKSAGKYHTL